MGRLYAVSTAGSILGVYLTGFVLVAVLGTRHVVLLAGFVLLRWPYSWDVCTRRVIAGLRSCRPWAAGLYVAATPPPRPL